jgi:DNA-directed RNA polymerase specialized sigma24 family protein
VSRGRDAEYTEYVAARLSSLRRLAGVLCGDWQRADDLVQATLTKLYVHWPRVRAATHPDAYARAVLVRESIHERRLVWAKRVSLSGGLSERQAVVQGRSFWGLSTAQMCLIRSPAMSKANTAAVTPSR